MAKIIYACARKIPFARDAETRLRALCVRLEPDNLSLPAPHQVAVDRTLAYAIVNGRNCVANGRSVLLGCLYGEEQGWETPGKAYPDGSYAMFRSDDGVLEVVSDPAASRTIWYYLDDELFLASTSQRAIVMFLGSFEFNEQVVPWMLSTGSLGPDLSWDRRIKRLPPDVSLMLDRKRWSMAVQARPIVFSPQPHPAHKDLLKNEIRAVVRSLTRSASFRFDDYVLPLSGGYDSRALLCFLAEREVPEKLRTVTWGLEQNQRRKGNDAAVARELAARIGVRHRYLHTDASAESIEKVIDRFVRCAEGRIDHVSAYADGLEIWRRLAEDESCGGIIRGDEGFGWIPVSSELTVRFNVGMALCSDYRNLEKIVDRFGLPAQAVPGELCRRKDESLSTWRDRLYHAYRLPTILAALSDVKCSYLEVLNPLLARSILHRVRQLPDRSRTGKALFKQIVDSISPDVPYAREDANEDLKLLLRKAEVVALMRDTIRSRAAKRVLHAGLLQHVLDCMGDRGAAGRGGTRRAWRRIASFVPRALKNWIRDRVAKPSLDGNVLAFRVFLILRMHELLASDCEAAGGARAAESGSARARIASAG